MLRYLSMDLGAGFKFENNNLGLKNPDFKTIGVLATPRPGRCPRLDLKQLQVSRDPSNSLYICSRSSVRDRCHLLASVCKIACSPKERREVMNRVCESSGKYSRSSAFRVGVFLNQEVEQILHAHACPKRDATTALLIFRCHLPEDTEVFVCCC